MYSGNFSRTACDPTWTCFILAARQWHGFYHREPHVKAINQERAQLLFSLLSERTSQVQRKNHENIEAPQLYSTAAFPCREALGRLATLDANIQLTLHYIHGKLWGQFPSYVDIVFHHN